MIIRFLSVTLLSGLFAASASAGCCQLPNGACSVHSNPTCKTKLKGVYKPLQVCAIQLKKGCVNPGSPFAPKSIAASGSFYSYEEFEKASETEDFHAEYYMKLESPEGVFVFSEEDLGALKEGAQIAITACQTAAIGEGGIELITYESEACLS